MWRRHERCQWHLDVSPAVVWSTLCSDVWMWLRVQPTRFKSNKFSTALALFQSQCWACAGQKGELFWSFCCSAQKLGCRVVIQLELIYHFLGWNSQSVGCTVKVSVSLRQRKGHDKATFLVFPFGLSLGGSRGLCCKMFCDIHALILKIDNNWKTASLGHKRYSRMKLSVIGINLERDVMSLTEDHTRH